MWFCWLSLYMFHFHRRILLHNGILHCLVYIHMWLYRLNWLCRFQVCCLCRSIWMRCLLLCCGCLWVWMLFLLFRLLCCLLLWWLIYFLLVLLWHWLFLLGLVLLLKFYCYCDVECSDFCCCVIEFVFPFGCCFCLSYVLAIYV